MGIALILALLELWPACPARGWVTSEYGWRTHPISHRRKFHRGVDVGNAAGTAIRTPWHARVVRVRRGSGMGLHVVLQAGPLRLTMAHMRSTEVRAGDVVARGDVVGRMGASGRATGPHLHLEVRRGGRLLDPSVALLGCRGPS